MTAFGIRVSPHEDALEKRMLDPVEQLQSWTNSPTERSKLSALDLLNNWKTDIKSLAARSKSKPESSSSEEESSDMK